LDWGKTPDWVFCRDLRGKAIEGEIHIPPKKGAWGKGMMTRGEKKWFEGP